MDLKDIAYRAGLIFAAFLLAGIFAQQLVHISSDADEAQVLHTVATLRDALGMILSSEEGSNMVISLGIDGDPGESALLLSDRLDGDRYSIEVLPGLMALRWAGGREVILYDRSLVPCSPPDGGSAINTSQLEVLKDGANGFNVMTPCRFHLSRPYGSQGALFVHVPPDDVGGAFENLSKTLRSDLGPYPGQRQELELEAPYGALIKERLLVFHGSGWESSAANGFLSSLPFVLPPGTSVETDGRQEVPPGAKLTIAKESVLRPDGNMTVLTRVVLNHPL